MMTSMERASSSLAALINALKIVGKRMEDIKLVVNGIGAAAWHAQRS
jgi:malic enzyme